MSTRYVVLLRGINVGKAKRIAMADLRVMLTDLGYTDVKTLLNSGNAVVTGEDGDPDEHAGRIHAAIADRFAMDVRCLVLTGERLRAIVDGHPFVEIADNGSRMFAHILDAAPDPALLAEHDPVALDPERARLGDRVVYQWCPDGSMEAPPVATYAEKHLGVTVTARNWNTMTKLLDLLG
ncbi:MAG: DUF1697 domain-containing protein [Pseudonocardia sp.]|uniref:DUF1697 domain-containing protein n=1 Tax=Pseudonocardia sp. TaxID=60912 RepID=UPI001AC78C48|nr:DUF1697 domain-containing protein [Pseudonocardia sp.]MBN9099686.1 DUF1697 domain-containing protein [Pseudonocardia sp.]